MNQSLTDYVATFAATTTPGLIPAEVRELSKKSILDALACAVSGSTADVSEIVHRYVRPYLGSEPLATIIGSAMRAQPRFAALANGTAMHAEDFDDTYQAAPDKIQGLHATAPVLAAVLACAEPEHRSGLDVLASCTVGVEVGCRIFDAASVDHVANGFHTTGTSGLLGAAAGIVNLKAQSVTQACTALSLAASQTGTLLCQLGTMAKAWHSGLAAEGAVVAADLASLGMTAASDPLGARWGFFQAEGGSYDDDRIRGLLGKPWTFLDRGQWIKPWPTGSLAHTAYSALLDILRTTQPDPADILAVVVRTRQSIYDTLFHHSPTNSTQARFSMEFGITSLLLNRTLGPNQFADDFVTNPVTRELMAKVRYHPFSDSEAVRMGKSLVSSTVQIHMRDGKVSHAERDYPFGSLMDPMSFAEVSNKFRQSAQAAGWSSRRAEQLILAVAEIDDMPDICELTAILAG